MGAKAGIRQIAAAAGVSTATVSRVLNDSANVSSGVRDAVLNAVAEHNYRPDAAAKALTTRRTRTIAAVIPTLEHSIFAVFMNALEDELAAAGFNLVIATHQFDQSIEYQRCNDVLKLGAEAIVVSGASHSSDFQDLIKMTGVPCIYTSIYSPDQPVPSMGYSNLELAKNAVQYLARLGNRHIRVVHGPVESNDRMRARVQGAAEAKALLSHITIDFCECDIGVGEATRVLQSWVNKQNLPDACLCFADVLALGIIQESNRLGISIPGTLSVMGFEDVEWAKHCSPRLTTVALPSEAMGRGVAAALIKHLDHGEPLEHLEFPASLIERETTAAKH